MAVEQSPLAIVIRDTDGRAEGRLRAFPAGLLGGRAYGPRPGSSLPPGTL